MKKGGVFSFAVSVLIPKLFKFCNMQIRKLMTS